MPRNDAYDIAARIEAAGVSLTSPQATGDMLEIVGEEVARKARRNARGKGGRRFWVQDILDSIHSESTSGGRIVGSTHVAAAHKQFGGEISAPGKGEGALRRQFLTIPAGKARENRWDTDKAKAAGSKLFRVKRKSDGALFLFGSREPATPKKGKGKGSPAELLFTLKKSVFQKADPWFPMGKELEEAVGKGIDLYLKTLE